MDLKSIVDEQNQAELERQRQELDRLKQPQEY